jgi:hypothetical protein
MLDSFREPANEKSGNDLISQKEPHKLVYDQMMGS